MTSFLDRRAPPCLGILVIILEYMDLQTPEFTAMIPLAFQVTITSIRKINLTEKVLTSSLDSLNQGYLGYKILESHSRLPLSCDKGFSVREELL